MITFCPECVAETESDIMPVHINPDKPLSEHIPARVFCAVCGWWIGYDDTIPPEPPVESGVVFTSALWSGTEDDAEPVNWPTQVTNPAPEFGRDSLPAWLDHYTSTLLAWGSFWL